MIVLKRYLIIVMVIFLALIASNVIAEEETFDEFFNVGLASDSYAFAEPGFIINPDLENTTKLSYGLGIPVGGTISGDESIRIGIRAILRKQYRNSIMLDFYTAAYLIIAGDEYEGNYGVGVDIMPHKIVGLRTELLYSHEEEKLSGSVGIVLGGSMGKTGFILAMLYIVAVGVALSQG